MKKTPLALLLLAACFGLPPVSASAQTGVDNSQTAQRLDRLENDITLLQRQVAHSQSAGTPPGSAMADLNATNPAQLEVRLSAIEDSVRDLRGRVEQNEFEMRKLSGNMDKLQRDVDYRFNQLQAAGGSAATTPAGNSQPQATPAPAQQPQPATGGETTAGNGVLTLPEGAASSSSTPRDLYNSAFRLLNQTQYEEAASAFDSFTKKYPKDPLVGNAFYWEGETYYIRRDYVKAADNFRQGFEALPDGPKAADNLLKLAMSLDALNRDKEACVVLEQIVTKFKKNSTTVTEKAGQEQKRIGCK